MGALLAILVNSPAVVKPPHIETHFECACSDTSSSSEEPKHTGHDSKAKVVEKT